MTISLKNLASYTTLTATLVLSAGCTTFISQGVNEQGRADEVIFPQVTEFEHKRAIFPTIENLRKVAPNISKYDLYYLLGAPHFREGINAREWDYLFKFYDTRDGYPSATGEQAVVECQYKVIFDKDFKGQSFYWNPERCAAFVKGAVPASAPGRYTLNNEVLFPHNRSGAADIRSEGRVAVRNLAAQIKNDYQSVNKITVVGHTDRLGSDAYNLTLSQARADSIRNLLLNEGLNASKIVALGAGKSRPLSSGCVGNKYTAALSACLQADRRVEIEVSGQRK